MQCVTHPSIEAVAYCRICGRAMCAECKRDVRGTVYCEGCLAREVAGPPVPTPGAVGHQGPIPGLALGLGFVPGVGAIYNGQYAKAFVHVIIFGTIVSILSSGEAGGFEPLFGIMLAFFVIYMAFEAFHTARKVSMGEPVDEWSGMFNASGSTPTGPASAVGPRAGGAAFLIGLGVLFLLNNFGILSFHSIIRFWPVILIAAGISMLASRMSGSEGGR